MDYQAGNLELSILGFHDSAVNSVNATAKALGSLYRVLSKIEHTNVAFSIHRLEALFKGIAKSTNYINTANISNLASAAKSLNSITKFANLEKMDFAKVGKGFNTLSIAIQPFLDKVKEAEAGLSSLYGILQKSSGKKIQGLLGGGGKGNKRGSIFGFLRGSASTYMMYRMGRFMANLVQAGSDYNETLNLWQVAMRNNLDVADQFVNKMQKAYGISTKTLMNAQAVFKNMIGSLGQISDATAYALSEALVQMSADYASLYNRTLESAFQNMQSMLAGQVRPIRSAGLDMTETTLFMFYQRLGGTKTMRQLNRTEKQLLSILAVYEQMGSAGALGDMSKTLNQFANQSRMMTEYWAELKTWSGLLLKDLIDQSGLLVHINALLITATEIVKAIAKSRGIGDENFLTGLFETADATNDAVDELQGKLLDFDKFRSLEGASASPLAIDEKLLKAITGYSSKIDQAQNAAKKLADTWLKFWLTEDGQITKNGEAWIAVIKGVGVAIGGVLALGVFASLVKFGIHIYSYGIKPIIAFGNAIYTHAIAPLMKWIAQLVATTPKLKLLEIGILAVGVAILGMGISEFISNFDKLSEKAKIWIPIIASLAGVITAVAAGLSFMKGNWIGAIGLGAAVAGIGLMVGTQLAIPNYERGASDIDSGTVFRAGEFGKTEAVYTGSNGKTNVANIQQMKAAELQALNEWWATAKHDIPVLQGVSESGLYTMVDGEANRRGKKFASV
jgi:hypothetical protein